MNDEKYKVYGYRWVVLGAFMLANATIQALWISYAPVEGIAARYYGVSELKIGFFAMSFMIAFIPLSIPVSWLIDKFGFAKIVGVGAVMAGIFGVLRGLAGPNYAIAMTATWGIAAAQPFLLNAWTKLPAEWFPAGERATAVGLVTLAGLVGTGAGMVATPILVESMPLSRVQMLFGLAACASALAFVAFAREKPRTPPDASASRERALMLDGLKHAISLPAFRTWLLGSFVGMGVFTGVTTWVEAIVRPRGIEPAKAGLLGAVMLAAGLFGAVVIPAISDRRGKRVPYLVIGFAGAVPGLLGLAFAPGFWTIAAASAILGFFLVSLNPVGMQYAAEVARPTPEGSSNGLITLAGQVSVVLVYGMAALAKATGSFSWALVMFAALLAVSAFLSSRLPEAKA